MHMHAHTHMHTEKKRADSGGSRGFTASTACEHSRREKLGLLDTFQSKLTCIFSIKCCEILCILIVNLPAHFFSGLAPDETEKEINTNIASKL